MIVIIQSDFVDEASKIIMNNGNSSKIYIQLTRSIVFTFTAAAAQQELFFSIFLYHSDVYRKMNEEGNYSCVQIQLLYTRLKVVHCLGDHDEEKMTTRRELYTQIKKTKTINRQQHKLGPYSFVLRKYRLHFPFFVSSIIVYTSAVPLLLHFCSQHNCCNHIFLSCNEFEKKNINNRSLRLRRKSSRGYRDLIIMSIQGNKRNNWRSLINAQEAKSCAISRGLIFNFSGRLYQRILHYILLML